MLRSTSFVFSTSRLAVVLPFAVLPTVLSLSLLSAGCGGSDPIEAGGATTAGGSAGSEAAAGAGGDAAGGQGSGGDAAGGQGASGGSSGSGAGGARAGSGGEVDDPEDAGRLGP